MNHHTYLIAAVLTLVLAFVVAFTLRRTFLNSEDSPAMRKWFGWFVGGLGSLCVLAYYASDDGTPDSIATGWALAVFGGYMVESGRLRQRINELELRLSSFEQQHRHQV